MSKSRTTQEVADFVSAHAPLKAFFCALKDFEHDHKTKMPNAGIGSAILESAMELEFMTEPVSALCVFIDNGETDHDIGFSKFVKTNWRDVFEIVTKD